jgi:hypothetical protein
LLGVSLGFRGEAIQPSEIFPKPAEARPKPEEAKSKQEEAKPKNFPSAKQDISRGYWRFQKKSLASPFPRRRPWRDSTLRSGDRAKVPRIPIFTKELSEKSNSPRQRYPGDRLGT